MVKSSFLFLGLAGVFAVADIPWFGSAPFAWFGAVQLLNALAPRLPFGRHLHSLHVLTFEPLALLALGLMRLFPHRGTVSGKGQPLLLVHGYFNHSCVWILQKKRLEALGFGPIYTISLGHPFRSIRHYAEKVRAEAERIAKQTGRSDLALIGHSMGGLVSCWYATQLAPAGSVTDVVTIATPLSGTPIARLGLGPNAREMEPNSPLVRELQVALSQKRGIRFHHIASKRDHLVIPGSSAALLTNNHFIFEDVGHTGLLFSQRVIQKIHAWLQNPCV